MKISNKLGINSKSQYTLDHCFNDYEDNQTVYNNMVKRIALSSLNGINGTIFMYG